ncbi:MULTISPECIES: hypothetical protein [unclassified Paenibacillus]|uniref:Uncharacterized protein n=1 Tax=Paenibacillus provencensis TaxID=441151 RepID=A0ABW3Q397_9BACL|nr:MULTISPECIES: hypothetical protein [unclassified Paenibacillus]MCM3130232.1 hypothetical protein [Paenibacillus sp. MER 78]SDX72185.1 hypothetical protein SAMN05518848_112123 [Paenibacillus sp. PDC88]SFS89180.1 hypothetical protein SAMN04488601_106119 [Paenibacillus sp. 453mf]
MINKNVFFDVETEFGVRTEVAKVKSVEFTKRGPVFTAITPLGNTVRLTKREISCVGNKKQQSTQRCT